MDMQAAVRAAYVCVTPYFFFSDVQQVLEKRGTYTVYSTCFVV